MGVKGLLKFLSTNTYINNDETNSCIQHIRFNDLREKTIVVDASIYMYRFKQEGDLAEMMYHFISLMRHYKVKLIFIFDGKPPEDKMDIIQSRQTARQVAKTNYDSQKIQQDKLVELLELEYISKKPDPLRIKSYKNMISRLEFKIESNRRNSITLQYTDLELVKRMLDMMGIYHTTPDQEADSLCARFVTSGIAYACLTEDTDLFVYGCDRIVRGLDIFSKTMVLYSTKSIYKSMGVSLEEFQSICFLSGTDYFTSSMGGGINAVYEWYKTIRNNSESFIDITDNILEENGINRSSLLCNYSCDQCDSDITSYTHKCNSVRYDAILTKNTMRRHGFIYI